MLDIFADKFSVFHKSGIFFFINSKHTAEATAFCAANAVNAYYNSLMEYIAKPAKNFI